MKSSHKFVQLVIIMLFIILIGQKFCLAQSNNGLPVPDNSRMKIVIISPYPADRLHWKGDITYMRADALSKIYGNVHSGAETTLFVEGDRHCEFRLGHVNCLIDGEPYELSAPMIIVRGHFFLPANDYAKIYNSVIRLPDTKPIIAHAREKQDFPTLPKKEQYTAQKPDKEVKIKTHEIEKPKLLESTGEPREEPKETPPLPSSELPAAPTEMSSSLKDRAKKYGLSLTLGYYGPDGGIIEGKDYSSKVLPGIAFLYKLNEKVVISTRYEQVKHAANGLLLGQANRGTLKTEERFLSARLRYYLPEIMKVSPFAFAGIAMTRIKLTYDDSTINTWKELAPVAYDCGLGAEFNIYKDLTGFLSFRYLAGDETITMPGLGKQLTFKLDDLFLELGTNYYFH